jgi:hypothetical protein
MKMIGVSSIATLVPVMSFAQQQQQQQQYSMMQPRSTYVDQSAISQPHYTQQQPFQFPSHPSQQSASYAPVPAATPALPGRVCLALPLDVPFPPTPPPSLSYPESDPPILFPRP